MFKLFFSPAGRISRSQYWLVHFAVIPLFVIAISPLFGVTNGNYGSAILKSLGYIALILPFSIWFGFCATAKRYHDRGKSAWWYLMIFVPYIGGIWHFVECGCLAGDSSTNEYGPAPGSASDRTYDDVKGLVEGETHARYEQAIQNALRFQNASLEPPPTIQHPKPAQQYHDRPRDGRPVFGKRV